MDSIPQPPSGSVNISAVQELHVLAGLLLCGYMRIADLHELLGSLKHGLRMIHSFALAISGILRHALNADELGAEEQCRGKAQADVSTDPSVHSLLLTSEHDVRRTWRAENDEKYFHISHSEFV